MESLWIVIGHCSQNYFLLEFRAYKWTKEQIFLKITQICFLLLIARRRWVSILRKNSGFKGKNDDFICLYK